MPPIIQGGVNSAKKYLMSYYKNFAEGIHTKEKNISQEEILNVQKEFENRRNELVLSFIPSQKTKLLEIGSGRGYFAAECQKRGDIEYFGIEPEETLYNSLKERGYNVDQRFVPPLSFDQGFFDVVCHFHVLEHMENPRQAFQFIQECSRVLKNNGLLIFRCPNALSWGMDFWDVDYTRSFPTTPTRVKQLLFDCELEVTYFKEISFFKPRHFGAFRWFFPRKIFFLNRLYPKISAFLGKFAKKDTELIFVCQKNNEKVKTSFNNYWKNYKKFNPVSMAIVNSMDESILKIARKLSPKNILEVGCGSGRMMKKLQKLAPYTGIDNTPSGIELSKSGNVYLMEADKTHFENNEFDLVYSERLLEHYPDFSPFVKEMARISKKWILLLQPNYHSPAGKLLNWGTKTFSRDPEEIPYKPSDYILSFSENNCTISLEKIILFSAFKIYLFQKNTSKK